MSRRLESTGQDSTSTTFRARVHKHLDPAAWGQKGISPVNWVVGGLIIVAGLLAVVETERSLTTGNETTFQIVESVFAALFLVEYAARVWSSAENPHYGPGLRGRVRYMLSWPALVDIVALVPVLITPFGAEAFLFRLLRLARILAVARLGRFSRAAIVLADAVRARGAELFLSLGVGVMLLIVSSTFLYLAEARAQPVEFGSIPRAMWWSVATLTTVGYGDVYPITIAGRIFAGLTAVAGIGVIAMPTGILAAAVSEAIQKHRIAARHRGHVNETEA